MGFVEPPCSQTRMRFEGRCATGALRAFTGESARNPEPEAPNPKPKIHPKNFEARTVAVQATLECRGLGGLDARVLGLSG